ncbi:MAG: hypothetical protein PHC61_05970 [Chitinivibrionales bacterium]|nr:hypothetical protein [Chitinivibrionales bacterium]
MALLVASGGAVSLTKDIGNNELCLDMSDPYYFSAGDYYSLGAGPIPVQNATGERAIYKELLVHGLRPNCLALEAGTEPLPLMGVAVRSFAPTWYARARMGENNLIKSITESVDFKEPWSLSAFVGHSVSFKTGDGSIQGHGNSGLLCTYGYYQIKDNTLVPDHWGEFEIKLKVDKSDSARCLATSYRVGSRLHSNPDILDGFYISLYRNRTDFFEKGFSLIKNTSAHLRCDFSYRPLRTLSVLLEAGKKYPFRIKNHSYALGLSLGVSWNVYNPYTGELAAGFKPNTLAPVINPLLTF